MSCHCIPDFPRCAPLLDPPDRAGKLHPHPAAHHSGPRDRMETTQELKLWRISIF
jgi:hypothetical protein